MTQRKIAVFVGSLRKESFNRKMAKALTALAPESLKLEIIEISGLPLYDQDLDDNPPAAWTEFRERVMNSDAFTNDNSVCFLSNFRSTNFILLAQSYEFSQFLFGKFVTKECKQSREPEFTDRIDEILT